MVFILHFYCKNLRKVYLGQRNKYIASVTEHNAIEDP